MEEYTFICVFIILFPGEIITEDYYYEFDGYTVIEGKYRFMSVVPYVTMYVIRFYIYTH